MTSGTTTTNLTWDAEERLKSVGSDTYTYNGIGQRVKKVQGSSTFNYTISGDSIDSAVLSDGAATYLHGTGLIGETRSSTTKFYHADSLGTTRAVTNVSASTTDTLDTDAFGMTVASSGSTPSPFGFAGQHGYQSDATGLMLLGHRFYDASTGRFISRDPIQDGNNWYIYCNNDPVSRVDPEGLEFSFGGDMELKRQFLKAIKYISRNQRMNDLYLLLDASDQIITVSRVRGTPTDPKSNYQYGTIYWDPTLGGVMRNGRRRSPALILAHEIGHAAGEVNSWSDQEDRKNDWSTRPTFPNAEEKHVIVDIENPTARSVGEPSRPSYDEPVRFIRVPSPTYH